MAIDLADYDRKARESVMVFWGYREKARQKQVKAGTADQGERAGVTAGKNMDGFLSLIKDLVVANGLGHAEIHQKKALLTLPGFFRPTKLWDILVIHKGKLIAAVELKVRLAHHLATTSITERKRRSERLMIFGQRTEKKRSVRPPALSLVGLCSWRMLPLQGVLSGVVAHILRCSRNSKGSLI